MPMRQRNDNGPERRVTIEQLEDGGRREYIYSDSPPLPFRKRGRELLLSQYPEELDFRRALGLSLVV